MIGFALLGCDRIGQVHARNIRAHAGAKLVTCYDVADDQRTEMFGQAGMLQAHNRHLTTVEAWSQERTRALDPVQDFFIARYADAYRAELDHFVECIETGAAPLAGFAEGREALRLANAALERMASRRAVRLGE